MKNSLKILALILITQFLGCDCKQNESKGNYIDLELENNNYSYNDIDYLNIDQKKLDNSFILFDSIFSEYICIGLKSESDKNLIGEINQLFIYDNKLYVADYVSKSIYIYDSKGDFLNKIHNIGKAENEYMSIRHVNFNDKLQRIEIYDKNQRKLLFYNFSGEFLYSRKIDLVFDSFIFYNNSYYFYCDYFPLKEGNYRLIKTDTTFNFKKGFFKYNKKMELAKSLAMNDNFYVGSNGLFMMESYNHYIYKINQNRIVPLTFINFKEDAFPLDLINKEGENFYNVIKDVDYSYIKEEIIINPPVYYLRYAYKGIFQNFLQIPTKKNKVKSYIYSGIVNIHDNFQLNKILAVDSNYVYFSIEPSLLPVEVINNINKRSLFWKEIQKTKLENYTNIVSNPIIIKCRLKDYYL